jgi:hypothetical protein
VHFALDQNAQTVPDRYILLTQKFTDKGICG